MSENSQTENSNLTENIADTNESANKEVDVSTVNTSDNEFEIDKKKWLYGFVAKIDNEDKKFFILKPGRKLKQAGELEYAKNLAKFVKAGLLPKAAWGTILDNAGGTISESEAETYTSLKNKFFELSLELYTAQQEEKTEENDLKIESLNSQIENVKNQIQAFELEQVYIFENTAEAKARNATIEWWLCNMAYQENNEPFFKGSLIEDKLDWYDSLDYENKADADVLKVGQRISYLVTMWFLNRIGTFDEFKEADIANTAKKNT